MSDEIPLDTRALRFDITVPSDERFRPVLAPICEKVAGYVGYSETAATELAEEVARVIDGLLGRDELSSSCDIDVSVVTTDRTIEFHLGANGVQLHTLTRTLPDET